MNQQLLYLNKYLDGGTRTFTIHLMHKLKKQIVFTVNNIDSKLHDLGNGFFYQNISEKDASQMDNSVVVIFKEDFLHVLQSLKNPTLVIHSLTDISDKTIPYLKDLKIITIRKSLQKYLKEKHNMDSIFKFLPFYPYPIVIANERHDAISISRISFRKNIDIIVDANKMMDNPVKIYGYPRAEYVQTLGDSFSRYYFGSFEKSFTELTRILSTTKYVVDLSAYNNDGGGMNYTFLEAIHNKCALILHRKWLEFEDSDFKEGYNCFAVESPQELAELLRKKPQTTKIVNNASKLLQRHIDVSWDDIF